MTEKAKEHSNYKGFVAGIFSGVSKLTGELSCGNVPTLLRH